MKISFQIGPAVISLIADLPPQDPQPELLTPFQIDPETKESSDITLRIRLEPPPKKSELAGVSEFEGSWRLFRRRNGWRLEGLDPLTRLHIKQVALISNDFTRAEFHLSTPASGWNLGEVMQPFVQWWLTGWLALRKQGMILHGCAVVQEGGGLAFIGPSGAGKSTLAGLCFNQKESGLTVLNDERIVIWEETDGWRVGGTPWAGMLWKVSPVTAPLAGLFTLKKAAENRIVPVSPMRFVTQLVSEAFHPIWSRPATEGLLAAAGRLVEQVPTGEFQFLKDPSAVDFLQEFLKDPAVVF